MNSKIYSISVGDSNYGNADNTNRQRQNSCEGGATDSRYSCFGQEYNYTMLLLPPMAFTLLEMDHCFSQEHINDKRMMANEWLVYVRREEFFLHLMQLLSRQILPKCLTTPPSKAASLLP